MRNPSSLHSGIVAIVESQDLVRGSDGVYGVINSGSFTGQEVEKDLRERVASQVYADYLAAISVSHSIQVMDNEVRRFLGTIPEGGVILDIGGCWGWHWRHLADDRPDVGVIIVDFVRANFVHAKSLLGALVGTQVVLVHADATDLPFATADGGVSGFDGVWTVQVFQHIPEFRAACMEAARVLRRGARFINHSLHVTPLNKAIHRILGRRYHESGMVDGAFFLARANEEQRRTVEEVFGSDCLDRYTECLFHPDLRMSFSGSTSNLVGRMDVVLSNCPRIGRWIARQRGFEIIKS